MKTPTITISVVINTYNSESVLARALNSIDWADEIIIMDMASTDKTLTIAKKYKTKTFSHPKVGYVEPARNAALAQATGDWILVLDADEVISSLLATKLRNLASGDATADAYYIPRKNNIFGDWVVAAGWWPDYQLRFFRRGVVSWQNKIHSLPKVNGTIDYLAPQTNLAIEHYNYVTVEEYLTRVNRYTTHEIEGRPVAAVSGHTLIATFRHELFRRLFFHKGITGGMRGVGLSLLQALYEVVVQLKSWEAQQHKEKTSSEETIVTELSLFASELHYWVADWHVRQASGLAKLVWLVRRRLHI